MEKEQKGEQENKKKEPEEQDKEKEGEQENKKRNQKSRVGYGIEEYEKENEEVLERRW